MDLFTRKSGAHLQGQGLLTIFCVRSNLVYIGRNLTKGIGDTMQGYDVFISYRRRGGKEYAEEFYNRLSNAGFSVFMDNAELHFGDFRKQLQRNNRLSRHLLVVLSPGALDRCSNKNDWVRKEITTALRQHKKIVLVCIAGFVFPADLPKELEPLKTLPQLRYEDTRTWAFIKAFAEGWKDADFTYIRETRNKYEKTAQSNLLDDWGDCMSPEEAFFDDYRDETAANQKDNGMYLGWVLLVGFVGLLMMDEFGDSLYMAASTGILCCQMLIWYVRRNNTLRTLRAATLARSVWSVCLMLLVIVAIGMGIMMVGSILTDVLKEQIPVMEYLLPIGLCTIAKTWLLYHLLTFLHPVWHFLNARASCLMTACLRRKRRLEMMTGKMVRLVVIILCIAAAFMVECMMIPHVSYQWALS